MASMLLNVRVCITSVASSVCCFSHACYARLPGSAAYGVAYLDCMTCHSPLRV